MVLRFIVAGCGRAFSSPAPWNPSDRSKQSSCECGCISSSRTCGIRNLTVPPQFSNEACVVRGTLDSGAARYGTRYRKSLLMERAYIRTWRIPDQAGALPISLSPETAQGTRGDILIIAPAGALLIVKIAHFFKKLNQAHRVGAGRRRQRPAIGRGPGAGLANGPTSRQGSKG